tara:strand:+ start:67 stop:393 length:327 start_codon:yes stop_codon:yes gene_type:complete
MAMMPNAPPGPPMGMPQMASPILETPQKQPEEPGSSTEALVMELGSAVGNVQRIMGELEARGVNVEEAIASAVPEEPLLGNMGMEPVGVGEELGMPVGGSTGLLGEIA